MKIAVQGLWHLGTVTAACLASLGHDVVGVDEDRARVDALNRGRAPIAEPGLDDLLGEGLEAGRLRFTTDAAAALAGAAVLWVTFDTPVDEDDRADVAAVERAIESTFPALAPDTVVLISSQVPVGTTTALQARYEAAHPGRDVAFAYSPENLRLGMALDVFLRPDRIVAGTATAAARARLAPLMATITDRVEWMSVESAEMVKHALNAFLATSVAFANEIATMCEAVGADAAAVAGALKSDVRIGPRAYLAPGAAFAGGTLARDVVFLGQLGDRYERVLPLLRSVKASNDAHRGWPARRAVEVVGDVRGRAIAVWGLTYKPGTDTLRRSSAIEWCKALGRLGARLRVFDPAVRDVPWQAQDGVLAVAPSALDAVSGAAALIVGTEWPELREVRADLVAEAAPGLSVLDPSRWLAATLGQHPAIRYFSVGRA